MKFIALFFSFNIIALTTKLHSQVLYSFATIEKPDYCSKDTFKIKNLIGRKAKIWHEGGVYSTLNLSNAYNDLSNEIKTKGGKSGWGNYNPKAGDVGTIVHIFPEKENNSKYIYLLKIDDNYIPVGCYYLTVNNIDGLLGSNHYFANLDDIILAYNQNKVEIHSEIWIRMNEENSSKGNLLKTVNLNDETSIEYYQDRQIRKTKAGEVIVQYIRTTTGRAILNYIIQKTLNFL